MESKYVCTLQHRRAQPIEGRGDDPYLFPSTSGLSAEHPPSQNKVCARVRVFSIHEEGASRTTTTTTKRIHRPSPYINQALFLK